MTPKFSKALLAAGLAAALVGCGGGSSTTMGDDMPPPSDSTAAEEAAQTLQVSYDIAKRRVDELLPTSGASQKKAAQDAVDALDSLINTTVDLSDADKEKFSGYVETLSISIDTKNATVMTDDSDETMPTADASAWLRGVPTATSTPLGEWPPATRLAGPTTNPDIRDGWTVTSYDYDDGTTTHEEGKTFMKTVTRMTPGITMRWDEVVLEAAKANRSSVIDTFLGGPRLVIEAERATDTTAGTTAGSGTVSTTISSHVAVDGTADNPTPLGTGLALFTGNQDHIRVTDFRRNDFTAMSISELVENGIAANTIDTSDQQTANVWVDLDTIRSLGTLSSTDPSAGIYVKWKGLPGKLTVQSSQSDLSIRLRFNNGRLEYFPASNIGSTNSVTITFRPFVSNDLDEINTNLHAEPLMLRSETTDMATTEFAYWAKQNQSSSAVTVSTFARGGMGDMAFDAVTDMPEMLTGSAEYNGLAAGYYAMGTESNGEFTADTMLTANFGANTDSETITVSGMIDNFMPITGDDNLSSWNLTLSPVMLNDDNLGNAFSGRTSGGDALGNWNGQFLGSANPGINLEDAADRADDYPEAVVGNFTGHFANNGHVAGAFGADYTE